MCQKNSWQSYKNMLHNILAGKVTLLSIDIGSAEYEATCSAFSFICCQYALGLKTRSCSVAFAKIRLLRVTFHSTR